MREKYNRFIVMVILYTLVGPAILISMSCGGGGGGGSGSITITGIPSISNLQYSPQTVTQNQGGGVVTVTASINFVDEKGDLTALILNVYNSQGVIVLTGTTSLQSISGRTSGVFTFQLQGVSTTNIGNYTFEVYVTDAVGNVSNKLTGTFSVTATSSPSDALLGNFTFVYQIINTWTDRVTLNRNSYNKTSEGTDIYLGFDATYPSVTMSAGAWYPSISRYLIVTIPTFSSIYYQGYQFIINSNNTLSGCYTLFTNNIPSNCYSFIIPTSRKTPPGSWDMPMESQNDPTDINEVFEKKMAEAQETQDQQAESVSSVAANLVPKMSELKALIENHR